MRRVGFLVVLTVWALQAVPAGAQEYGFIWTLNRGIHTLDEKGHWTATLELELKLLDTQAARNGSRADISYYADMQTLEIVEAATIKSDGRVLPVAADKIFDTAPQVAPQVALFSTLRTKSIVFPDVGAGDSVRYVYRLKQFASFWPGFSWSMAPNRTVRAVAAEYTFDYPAKLPLNVESHGLQRQVETSGDRIRQVFSLSTAKEVRAEAGSTAPLDWSDRFSISTFRSYEEIGDHYGRLHAASSAATSEVAALADEIVGATADRSAQARLLYEWVAQNVRYVAVNIGDSAHAPASAHETIQNRYGDCKAHVALLAALLAAKGISSEPALINILSARYVLPDTPVADFDHVILYLPDLDRYVEPTSHYAAFGVLPWTHFDKPVLHAVEGKSRLARVPRSRVEDNVSEVFVSAKVDPAGKISGMTRETAKGSLALDLKYWSAAALTTSKAQEQLGRFGPPGAGHWTSPRREDLAPEVTLIGDFSQLDTIDLAAGEALVPPPGLRFLSRPGYFFVGTHEVQRHNPFPCHAGRQIENFEVAVPADLKPLRLPAARAWQTSVASYRSSYAFHDGKLYVRREFTAHPKGEVCTPEQSKELVGLQSDIRRDYRSVVVFDKAL